MLKQVAVAVALVVAGFGLGWVARGESDAELPSGVQTISIHSPDPTSPNGKRFVSLQVSSVDAKSKTVNLDAEEPGTWIVTTSPVPIGVTDAHGSRGWTVYRAKVFRESP